MKSKLLLSLMCLFALVSHAQQRIIKGHVTDADNTPLIGASVTIRSPFQGVVTNEDGFFLFKIETNTAYQLDVSYIGYEAQTIGVASDVMSKDLDIVLSTASYLANEVQITGVRASDKTPIAFTNISAKEIKENSNGQDIGYQLALTPSLVQTSESGTGIGYTSFRIRGTDPSRTNVTVDGIPLNDSESQQVFWVNMPSLSSSLSSMQIQRGVGTSTNGSSAFGASINMQTESPTADAYAELSSTVGSYGTFINTVEGGTGIINDKFALDFRYSNLKSDGYVDYATSDNQSLQVTGTYLTKKGRIKANVILGEQHSGISWWGVQADSLESNRTFNEAGQYITKPDSTPAYYEDQTDNYWQNHYHLSYMTEINDNLFLNVGLHYTHGEGYYEQYKRDQNFAKYGLDDITVGSETITMTDLVRQKWLDNDFGGGVFSLNYDKEALQLTVGGGLNYYSGDHFGEIIWMRQAYDVEKDQRWYENTGNKLDGNFFAKANYQLTEQLSVYGDVQYRYVGYEMEGMDDDVYGRVLDQEHTFNFVNPKAGVFYNINDDQSVYASYAMAHREPTRTNFKKATDEDFAGPKAETLNDVEVGYNFTSEYFAIAANYYFMYYKDQLVPTGELSTDGNPVLINVDESYRTGIELSLGVKPTSFIEWNTNLTLSQNKIIDFEESYVDTDADWNEFEKTRQLGDVDIAYSPSIVWSSDLRFDITKTLKFHFISQYVGKQYFDNTMTDARSIDAYFVNNLKLDYSLPIKNVGVLGLSCYVNNVFNLEYVSNAYGGTWWEEGTEKTWAYYFPQAPANVLFKASLRF